MKLDYLIDELTNKDILRYWSKVLPHSCWEWQGTQIRGYGILKIRNSLKSYTLSAHRISYQLLTQSLPADSLDHLCQNTICVNPDHLEPVPLIVNVERAHGVGMLNKSKTHCVNGHLFDSLNTYLYTRKNGKSMRLCKSCRNSKSS